MGIDILEELPSLRAGQKGFGHGHDIVGSRQIESDAPAGVYVHISGGGLCDLPGTTGEVTEGTGGVLLNLADRIANANELEYAADDYVQYLEEGVVVVITDQAVNDGDAAFVRFVAGGGEQLGAFRKDADTADAVALPGAFFVGTYSAGLAKVRLR